MALTKITSDAITPDAVVGAKIADNAINSEHYTDESIDLVHMSSDSVNESKLNVSNAGTNGQFLQKQSGNTGGLTWADAGSSVGGSTGVDFNDGVKARFGTDNDLELYHDGSHGYLTNTTGVMHLMAKSGENGIKVNPDGGIELYYDNSKKIETTSTGTLISGTQAELSATGASDEPTVKVTSENGGIFLRSAGSSGSFPTGGGGDDGELLYLGGDFRLGIGTASKNLIFMNGSSYQERARINSSGSFKLPDDGKIELGGAQTGSGDLQIHHDGSDSHIHDNGTGSLLIRSDSFRLNNAANSENMITANEDGAVSLYHDGTKQVETDANGIKFVDGKGITLGTDDDLKIYQSGTDTVFKKFVAGSVFFEDSIAVATTAVPWRFGKTNNSATTNERHNMFSFGLPGVNRGLAQCGSSNSVAPQWAASSDYRIKENFRPYTGGWDAIKAIPVQLYDEKSPSYWTQGSDKKDLKGWKAHEVQAVIPEAVTGAKDAVVTQAMIDAGLYQQSELNHIIPQQLGTTSMIPDLIGALQQAMAKIETLETKVAALEAG